MRLPIEAQFMAAALFGTALFTPAAAQEGRAREQTVPPGQPAQRMPGMSDGRGGTMMQMMQDPAMQKQMQRMMDNCHRMMTGSGSAGSASGSQEMPSHHGMTGMTSDPEMTKRMTEVMQHCNRMMEQSMAAGQAKKPAPDNAKPR